MRAQEDLGLDNELKDWTISDDDLPENANCLTSADLTTILNIIKIDNFDRLEPYLSVLLQEKNKKLLFSYQTLDFPLFSLKKGGSFIDIYYYLFAFAIHKQSYKTIEKFIIFCKKNIRLINRIHKETSTGKLTYLFDKKRPSYFISWRFEQKMLDVYIMKTLFEREDIRLIKYLLCYYHHT